jgi:hypothetical protein
MAKRKDDDRLDECRRRYRKAREAYQVLYDKALEDIRFVTVPGNQWDASLRQRRGKRPTYEFPKLRMMCQQIINEQKQSRPQGKVRGVEESDRSLAELMQGLCRNIESASNAEQAYDIAFEAAVRGGFGAFRVTTDYASQDDFDLDIRIKPLRNPFCLWFDPAAIEIDRRDAGFAFLEELISEAEFERRFPGKDMDGFFDSEETVDFREKGQVKVMEYWYKKPIKRELWRLSNGVQTYADESPLSAEELAAVGVQVVRTREVESHTVCMQLTNGQQWLSEPVEFPSKFIPLIPVWGNIDNIEGEDYFSGAVRFSKDSQRLHNLHKTAVAEAVAKAPKAPFVTTPSAILGYEDQWKSANAEDYPYLLVNDGAPVPQRTQQAEIPMALLQLASGDNDDMRSQTGQYAANLGAPSNESSGKAIGLRRQQGATATFNYIDNLTYSIKYLYEILVDMIPRVYDTPRVVRVLGDDGGTKWKQLYQEVIDPSTQQPVILNDISKGKYDVAVTVGPSYATQRMEAAEGFTQLAGQVGGADPQLAQMLVYSVLLNTDLPGTDAMVKSMRKRLVGQGLLDPEEGEAPPPPAGPPPEILAKQAELQQEAQLRQMELEAQAQVKQMELEAQAQIRQIEAQAKFAAEQAKQQAEDERLAYKLRFDAQVESAKIESQERIKAAELESAALIAQANNRNDLAEQAMRMQREAAEREQGEGRVIDALGAVRELAAKMTGNRTVLRDEQGNIVGVRSE